MILLGDNLLVFVDSPGFGSYPGWRLSGNRAVSRLQNYPRCREYPLFRVAVKYRDYLRLEAFLEFGDYPGLGDHACSRAGLAFPAQAVRS